MWLRMSVAGRKRGWVAAYLARSVYNVTLELGALAADALGESSLDGGVVRLDELVFDELNDERRFSCGARAGSVIRAIAGA